MLSVLIRPMPAGPHWVLPCDGRGQAQLLGRWEWIGVLRKQLLYS